MSGPLCVAGFGTFPWTWPGPDDGPNTTNTVGNRTSLGPALELAALFRRRSLLLVTDSGHKLSRLKVLNAHRPSKSVTHSRCIEVLTP